RAQVRSMSSDSSLPSCSSEDLDVRFCHFNHMTLQPKVSEKSGMRNRAQGFEFQGRIGIQHRAEFQSRVIFVRCLNQWGMTRSDLLKAFAALQNRLIRFSRLACSHHLLIAREKHEFKGP